ncbi:MAG: tetratricopeptide repeat protein [Ktedonobacteraceae bacterium]
MDEVQSSEQEKKLGPNLFLTREREKRNWSQDEVANMIDTTKQNVSRWERGHTKPNPYFRQKLCVLFEKTAAELGFVAQEMIKASWNLPMPENLFFLGRTSVLESLHDGFARSKSAIPKQALTGLPGIGKTHAALEYAYRFQEEYSAALWLQASTEEILVNELVQLASILHLPFNKERDQERIVRAVKEWFDSTPGWLLILDNVRDPELVARKLPLAGRGHMLLTTQAQAIGTFASRIDMEGLTQEEGATFLLRRTKLIKPFHMLDTALPDDRTGAWNLANVMGGLPLALDQAAAYIEETQCGVSAYLDHYMARRAELLQRRGRRVSGHPASVATTISLAFENIVQNHPAAADLLRLCAYLYAEDIPLNIFAAGASALGPSLGPVAANPGHLDETIAELLNYSLIQRLRPEGLRIHRLVQAILQDIIMDQQARDAWVERTVYSIAKALPSEEADVKQCEPYIPHALACVELIEQRHLVNPAAAHIYYMTGFYQRERALYGQAVVHCQSAVDLYEQLLGPDHWEVAHALNNLALVYEEWGKYTEAEPRFRRVLTILEQTLPPNHPDLAGSLHNLAQCRLFQGDFSEAERFSQRELAIREKAVGPDHLDLGPHLNTLATIYREQGNYAQAELLYMRALAIREKALPPGHLDIAYSLNALATNYVDQGAYDRAEVLNLRALAIFEQVRGPDHPDVALCLTCLSDSYYFQKKYTRVKQMNQRALAIYEQVEAREHPTAARAMGNLALIYEGEGDYTLAMKLQQQALALLENALGPEHPDLFAYLWHYAQTLRKVGQEQEALPLEARARTLLRQRRRLRGE